MNSHNTDKEKKKSQEAGLTIGKVVWWGSFTSRAYKQFSIIFLFWLDFEIKTLLFFKLFFKTMLNIKI